MSNTYLSVEQAALKLNYSVRYFREVVIKKFFNEGEHYVYAFNGRKILIIWEAVELELLNSSCRNNQTKIPMASGGYVNG